MLGWAQREQSASLLNVFFVVLKYLFDHAVQHVLISVPWPGIEPVPPALGVWSLSYCTAREVPNVLT